ncbi:MAG TPA: hypothetical protein VEI57_04530 [Nitrospirota bacterium]|nr:hypothetical protein [Nitrospirota bacterium]
MTVFPFPINEVMRLDDRLSKLKPSTLFEEDEGEPRTPSIYRRRRRSGWSSIKHGPK